MLRQFLYSLTLSLLVSNLAYSQGKDCNQVLHLFSAIQPKIGEAVVSEKILSELPYSKLEYDVFLLGKGGTGTVYRLISKKNPADRFAVKVSKRHDAVRDHVLLTLLRDFGGQDTVEVVSSKLLAIKDESSALQMEDVRGRTLFSVLIDPAIADEVKANLVERYNAFIKRVTEQLDTRFQTRAYLQTLDREMYFDSERPVGMPYDVFLKGVAKQPAVLRAQVEIKTIFEKMSFSQTIQESFESTTLGIILKSDNFIVLPKGGLYLIDPY